MLRFRHCPATHPLVLTALASLVVGILYFARCRLPRPDRVGSDCDLGCDNFRRDPREVFFARVDEPLKHYLADCRARRRPPSQSCRALAQIDRATTGPMAPSVCGPRNYLVVVIPSLLCLRVGSSLCCAQRVPRSIVVECRRRAEELRRRVCPSIRRPLFTSPRC